MQPEADHCRPFDPREFVTLLAPIDLRPADEAACDAGRELASKLISPHIASAAALRRVQAKTRAAIFVQLADGAVSGVTGMLPLNAAGLTAIVEHRFNAKEPADEYLCAPGEPMATMYAWAFAATTRKASAAVIQMMIVLRDHYLDIPCFTRAVTAAGAKVVRGRMGYHPYPGAPDDLLWNPVRINQERAA